MPLHCDLSHMLCLFPGEALGSVSSCDQPEVVLKSGGHSTRHCQTWNLCLRARLQTPPASATSQLQYPSLINLLPEDVQLTQTSCTYLPGDIIIILSRALLCLGCCHCSPMTAPLTTRSTLPTTERKC